MTIPTLQTSEYPPNMTRQGDLWLSPVGDKSTGDIFQYTKNGGWVDLVIDTLYRSLKKRGFTGTKEELLDNLIEETEAPDTASGIKLTSGKSVQDTVDSLPTNVSYLISSRRDPGYMVLILDQWHLFEDGVYKPSGVKGEMRLEAVSDAASGVMLPAHKIKLDSIEAQATRNVAQVPPVPLDPDTPLSEVIAAFNSLLADLRAASIYE